MTNTTKKNRQKNIHCSVRFAMPRLRVCVIGAGAAGLAAARHLTSELDAFDLRVFEQASRVGGTWVYTENTGIDERGIPVHSSMYRNLR